MHPEQREPKAFIPRLRPTFLTIDPGGGTGGLGLLFAAWFAEKGAGHLALLSRSGKIAQD